MFKVKRKMSYAPCLPETVYSVSEGNTGIIYFLFYQNSEWIWDMANDYEPWTESR